MGMCGWPWVMGPRVRVLPGDHSLQLLCVSSILPGKLLTPALGFLLPAPITCFVPREEETFS